MPRFHRFMAAAALALAAACTSNATSSRASTTRAANGDVIAAGAAADSVAQRADRGRILGDTTAKLWVIMASDFQCPYCKQWHDARFTQLMQNYVAKGRIRLGFINFPLSQHPNALPASEAAMCASAQGKFLAMHESLFATQSKWENLRNPMLVFDSLAQAAGVNFTAYKDCVNGHLALPLIEADHDRWATAGVRSTPTFFVGSTMLQGADADLGAAIDSAFARASKKAK